MLAAAASSVQPSPSARPSPLWPRPSGFQFVPEPRLLERLDTLCAAGPWYGQPGRPLLTLRRTADALKEMAGILQSVTYMRKGVHARLLAWIRAQALSTAQQVPRPQTRVSSCHC